MNMTAEKGQGNGRCEQLRVVVVDGVQLGKGEEAAHEGRKRW